MDSVDDSELLAILLSRLFLNDLSRCTSLESAELPPTRRTVPPACDGEPGSFALVPAPRRVLGRHSPVLGGARDVDRWR